MYDQCGLRSMAVKLWNDQVRRIYPLSKSLPGSAWICMGAARSMFFKLATREMDWKAEAAADGLQIFI